MIVGVEWNLPVVLLQLLSEVQVTYIRRYHCAKLFLSRRVFISGSTKKNPLEDSTVVTNYYASASLSKSRQALTDGGHPHCEHCTTSLDK